MDKEEILRKSREEQRDEGQEYADNRGRKLGISAMTAVMVILVIFNAANDESVYAVLGMYWIYLGFEALGKYRVAKERTMLVSTVAGVFAGAVFVLCHILRVLRIF